MKTTGIPEFSFVPVVKKGRAEEMNESEDDIIFWLSRPVKERVAAVTFLISQSLAKGEKMDKSIVSKRRHRSK